MRIGIVVVDMENDFIDGSLAVVGSGVVIETIKEIAQRFGSRIVAAAFSRDFHPADHFSFSDKPQYRDGSWPAHGVEDTEGSIIPQELLDLFPNAVVFNKGQDKNVEQYSAVGAIEEDDGITLLEWLDENEIHVVIVVGLALDYCVLNTASDLAVEGFTVYLPVEGTRAVNYETGALAIAQLVEDGVRVLSLNELDRLI